MALPWVVVLAGLIIFGKDFEEFGSPLNSSGSSYIGWKHWYRIVEEMKCSDLNVAALFVHQKKDDFDRDNWKWVIWI